MFSRTLPALVAFLLCCTALADTDLAAEIRAADARLFDAFNRCDVDAMGALYAEDLEFYHDTGGLDGRTRTLEKTRAMCERELGLVRTLVDDEVHPVAGHGAIHVGRHRFCHPVDGVEDCGTFEFLHVWKRTQDGWKLARVVSYGH